MRIRHVALVSLLAAAWTRPGLAQPSPKPPTKPQPAKPKPTLASRVELSNAAADIARLQFYVDHLEHRGSSCREYKRSASCATIKLRARQHLIRAEKHLVRLRKAASARRDAPGLRAVKDAQALLNRVDSTLLQVVLGGLGQNEDRYDKVRAQLRNALDILAAEHSYAQRPDATLAARATALRAGLELQKLSHLPLTAAQLGRVRAESKRITLRRRKLENSAKGALKLRLQRAKTRFTNLEAAVRELNTHNDPEHVESVKNAAAALARALS